MIAKPVGPICNLDCKYCFYLEKEKLYPEVSNWQMSAEVLETYIRDYISAQEVPYVGFTWQGGEPTLLGIEFFRNVVAFQKKYCCGKQIENAFQTNAVLLDNDWAEFLAENRFLVGVSIDGPAHLHDPYRQTKGGRGTFDDVVRGIRILQQHAVEFNTLTVVNKLNSQEPLPVYRFLKELGSRFLQFIPVVERVATSPTDAGLSLVGPDFRGDAQVSDWSVEPRQFGRFLCEIFDEWVTRDVAQVFVQLFDVTLENWLGMTPALCVFRETCGSALAIEHNGDLYSCDHFVDPAHRLGNILERPLDLLVNSTAQVAFGNHKRNSLPQYCRNCEVRFACNGECPKHRFAFTPSGEAGLNYLCDGYKLFFNHVRLPMDHMAAELRAGRPATSVMSVAWPKLS